MRIFKKKIDNHLLSLKRLMNFLTCENVSKFPKIKVFATFLENGNQDFSKIVTYHVLFCILSMLKKLGQKSNFSQIYDPKLIEI